MINIHTSSENVTTVVSDDDGLKQLVKLLFKEEKPMIVYNDHPDHIPFYLNVPAKKKKKK